MQDQPEDADRAELAELEQELREAAAHADPVPAGLLQAAVNSFGWRTIDTDLAELVFDSLAQDERALVRGPEQGRLLSFEAGGLTIDVELTQAGPARRLIGQLAPPQRAAVELRHPGGVATLDADELGRFTTGDLPAGPISLRCAVGGEPARQVVTDWVPI